MRRRFIDNVTPPGRLESATRSGIVVAETNGTDTLIQKSGGGLFTFIRGGTCSNVAVPGWSYTHHHGEDWWYFTTAQFYRPYSPVHPREDWTTCWEAFFYGDPDDDSGVPDWDHSWMETWMPEKFGLVDDFLRNFED